jgi:hypothetical protein
MNGDEEELDPWACPKTNPIRLLFDILVWGLFLVFACSNNYPLAY